jgi:hypothetical protein
VAYKLKLFRILFNAIERADWAAALIIGAKIRTLYPEG